MMKLQYCFAFFLVFGMIVSCQKDKNEQILVAVEHCLETCPDTAWDMLEKGIDSAKLSEYQHALYALLWTQTTHKCRLPLGNDSLINVAVKYFVNREECHYAAKAFLYKGLVHKENGEVEKAIEAFALSEQWFEGVEDDQYKALLYSHYGTMMMNEGNYEDALHYLKRSYHFKLRGDSVHYIMSACAILAKNYRMLGQMDSARFYFESGLQYIDRVSAEQYSLYMKDYANFLRKNKEYERAEEMLLECEQQVADEQIYTVYSSLATLYYDIGHYEKAQVYAEKMLDSKDSLILRGCYLHLYRIYRQQGLISKAQGYHDLYRIYHDEITMRLKTKEVSIVPHRIRAELLEAENLKGARLRWMLVVGVIVVLVGSICIYVILHRRYRQKQRCLHEKLTEEQLAHETDVDNLGKELYEQTLETAKLRGALTNKKKKEERVKLEMEDASHKRQEIIDRQKELLDSMKREFTTIKRQKQELEKVLEEHVKIQKKLKVDNRRLEHEVAVKDRIEYFRQKGTDEDTIFMLRWLNTGIQEQGKRYDIEEIQALLFELLNVEYPGMSGSIHNYTTNMTKRILCCLIALGFDDEVMHFRAIPNVSEKTVRNYHKECRKIVEDISCQ